jgi:hypothetical protein
MKEPFVLVADPPQPEVVDLPAVSRILGIQLADARGKVGYAFPEIWALTESEAEAKAKAEQLAAAKARCLVLAARDLAAAPRAEEAKAFDFTDEGLAWRTASGVEGDLLWKEIAVGVVYRTTTTKKATAAFSAQKFASNMNRKAGALRIHARLAGGLTGALLGGAADNMSVPVAKMSTVSFDECFELAGIAHPAGPRRVLLRRNGLDYAGLGSRKVASAQINWTTLQKLLSERVPLLAVDRRGEKLTPRPTLVGGVAVAKLVADADEAVKETLCDAHELLVSLACALKLAV